MSKSFAPRMSAARRNAEAILGQSQKRQDRFKQEQQQAHDAVAEKTARLRELRLAKEAADAAAESAAESLTPARKRPKVRRSKQT